MTLRSLSTMPALLVALIVPACTAEQAYNSAQGWKQEQCNKIPDKAEFDRCMSRVGTGYDAYTRQTEPGRK